MEIKLTLYINLINTHLDTLMKSHIGVWPKLLLKLCSFTPIMLFSTSFPSNLYGLSPSTYLSGKIFLPNSSLRFSKSSNPIFFSRISIKYEFVCCTGSDCYFLLPSFSSDGWCFSLMYLRRFSVPSHLKPGFFEGKVVFLTRPSDLKTLMIS